MDRDEKWIMGGIIVLGIVIRLLLLGLHDLPETDGIYYMSLGENFFSEGKYVDIEGNLNTNLTPGYPFLIGALSQIMPMKVAARGLSLLAGLALIVVMYFLGKRIYSKVVGFIAAGIVAVYPALTYTSTLTYNDSLFLLVLSLSMLLTFILADNLKEYRAHTKTYLLTIGIGLLSGFGYLVRPEGAVYTLIFIAATILFCYQKNIKWTKTITYGILIILGFLILAFPYLSFVHDNTDEWTLSTKARFTYLQREHEVFSQEYEKNLFSLSDNNTRVALNPYNQTFASTGISDIILDDPGKFASRYGKNIFKEFNYALPTLIPVPLLLLIIFGFCVTRWTRKRVVKEIVLVLLVLYPLVLTPVFWVEERYFLSILPVVILWLALGVLALEKVVKYKWDYKTLGVSLIILLALSNLFIPLLITKNAFEKDNPPLEHKEAGLWLKEYGEDPVVMARKPWAAHYAQGRYVYLPYGSYEDTLDYACKNGVNYMIIDERYVGNLRPELKVLLSETKEGLKRVYETTQDKTLYVYQLEMC